MQLSYRPEKSLKILLRIYHSFCLHMCSLSLPLSLSVCVCLYLFFSRFLRVSLCVYVCVWVLHWWGVCVWWWGCRGFRLFSQLRQPGVHFPHLPTAVLSSHAMQTSQCHHSSSSPSASPSPSPRLVFHLPTKRSAQRRHTVPHYVSGKRGPILSSLSYESDT